MSFSNAGGDHCGTRICCHSSMIQIKSIGVLSRLGCTYFNLIVNSLVLFKLFYCIFQVLYLHLLLSHLLVQLCQPCLVVSMPLTLGNYLRKARLVPFCMLSIL